MNVSEKASWTPSNGLWGFYWGLRGFQVLFYIFPVFQKDKMCRMRFFAYSSAAD